MTTVTRRQHLRSVEAPLPLPEVVQKLYDGLSQALEHTMLEYLARMEQQYGANAITYTRLKNGRVRGTMRTLDGRRRTVVADSTPFAARQLALVLKVVCCAQQAGVSEAYYRRAFLRP